MQDPTQLVRKLIPFVLITVPMIAIIGVAPLYFVGKGQDLLPSIIGLISINITLVWGANLLLVWKFSHLKPWLFYLISFLSVVLINILFRLVVNVPIPRDIIPVNTYIFPLINTLVINVIILILIELVRTREGRRVAEATIDKLQIENLEAQKQSLIRQMQPHFLFNSLSTLKALIGENEKDAEKYVVKLSNFLRYSFSGQTGDLTTVEKELDFSLNYIDLQSIRFEDAFSYEITIPEEVKGHRIPVFALQTLVENIFKHNYFSQKRRLRFSITYEAGLLVVWNEKVGFKVTERNETGLANLDRRYELTNGSHIEVIDQETEFTVKIPILQP